MQNKHIKRNNPRNATSELFKRLTRLLSGPIVDRRREAPRRNKRRQLDKFKFTSASGQQFKKSSYNPYEALQLDLMATQSRLDRYVDFDQMEYTPEIASALDIYADEMTTSNTFHPMLRVKTHNEEIKGVLNTLYNDVLNIEFSLFGWCRTMCKYGDFFLYLDLDEKVGIKNTIALPVGEVERLEGEDKNNPNYIHYQWNSAGITLENWQVAHFRILGNDKFTPYGTSVLDPARRIWRQLVLLEDAMMAYRIVRSPERRVFYIDVGNIAPPDIEQYMQKVMTQMKRNQLVDTTSGRVDLRYNPLSTEEDYFIPVRGDTSSKIETLPGGTYTGDIDDVKYLRDKLFSALKIPASYLSNSDDGAGEDKTTLAQKDVRFARTIQRLQRSIIAELEKIGIIHLYTLGYRGSDLISFNLQLNNPSKIAELQELEQWRTKFDVANGATDGYFSKRWISENLFGLAEEELIRMQREMFFDKKFEAALEVASQDVAEEGGGLEGLGDAGGALGGPFGDEGGLGDLEGEAGLEDAGTDIEPEGEETLLAEPPSPEAPAKRDSNAISSKGKKYEPGINQRSMGGRANSWKASVGHRVTRSNNSNINKGHQEIMGLTRLSEGVDSTYKREEAQIFGTSQEIKQLLEGLDYKKEQEIL
mgnify:CR=1 FL=1